MLIFASSIIETGLGFIALSATTFRHIFPGSLPEQPPAEPGSASSSPEEPPDAASTSSSVTGVELQPQTSGTQRKVSEEKVKEEVKTD
jgi:hypothetical protein